MIRPLIAGMSLLAILLACSGMGTPAGTGSGPSLLPARTATAGPEDYRDLTHTTWAFREKRDWGIWHDVNGVPSKNFGKVRTGKVKDYNGETWLWDFDERQYPTQRLDSCHVGFTGAFEGHTIRAAHRTFPKCDPALCTYDDLPFTTWEISGFERGKRTFTIDHQGRVSAWFKDEPGKAIRTATGMRLEWPDWSIDLQRLDKCQYAGSKVLPNSELAAHWRVERSWPSCGCP